MTEEEKIKLIIEFLQKLQSQGKFYPMVTLIEKCKKEKISYPKVIREILNKKLEKILV